jgi:hypothetical protein
MTLEETCSSKTSGSPRITQRYTSENRRENLKSHNTRILVLRMLSVYNFQYATFAQNQYQIVQIYNLQWKGWNNGFWHSDR